MVQQIKTFYLTLRNEIIIDIDCSHTGNVTNGVHDNHTDTCQTKLDQQEKNSTPRILGSEDENGDAENETDT